MVKLKFFLIATLLLVYSFVYLDFVEKSFYQNRISISVPANFIELSENQVLQKYSASNKPDFVLADNGEELNIALKVPGAEVPKEEIEDFGSFMEQQFKSSPGISRITSRLEKINNLDCYVLEFSSMAIDGSIHNLMYLTSIDGELLTISINSKSQYWEKWKGVTTKIVASVKQN